MVDPSRKVTPHPPCWPRSCTTIRVEIRRSWPALLRPPARRSYRPAHESGDLAALLDSIGAAPGLPQLVAGLPGGPGWLTLGEVAEGTALDGWLDDAPRPRRPPRRGGGVPRDLSRRRHRAAAHHRAPHRPRLAARPGHHRRPPPPPGRPHRRGRHRRTCVACGRRVHGVDRRRDVRTVRCPAGPGFVRRARDVGHPRRRDRVLRHGGRTAFRPRP